MWKPRQNLQCVRVAMSTLILTMQKSLMTMAMQLQLSVIIAGWRIHSIIGTSNTVYKDKVHLSKLFQTILTKPMSSVSYNVWSHNNLQQCTAAASFILSAPPPNYKAQTTKKNPVIVAICFH